MISLFSDYGKGTLAMSMLFINLLVLVLAFEIIMFVHVLKNKHISKNKRIYWVIGMLLLHPIVAIFYFFTDFKAKI